MTGGLRADEGSTASSRDFESTGRRVSSRRPLVERFACATHLEGDQPAGPMGSRRPTERCPETASDDATPGLGRRDQR